MADSFIPDSFTPDKAAASPEKKAKAEPYYPGQYLGLPKIKSGLDVVLNPEGIPQHLISMGVTGGAIGKGGQLAAQGAKALGLPELAAKVAPSLGRVMTASGLGAAEAVNRGESSTGVTNKAVLDGIIAGATEGILGVAGRMARKTVAAELKSAEAQKAYAFARDAPQQALEAISPRIGQYELLHIPSLSNRPMSISEIPELLKSKQGVDFSEARREIISELNRLSGTGVAKNLGAAGESFAERTSAQKFLPQPPPGRPFTGDTARAGAEAVLTQPGPGGWPVGAGLGAMVGGHIPEHLLRMLLYRGLH